MFPPIFQMKVFWVQTKFACCAEVDYVLEIGEAVLYSDPTDFFQLLKKSHVSNIENLLPGQLESKVMFHGTAYSRGLISLPRLMEVVFHPFFKLAKKVNTASESSDAKILKKWRELMEASWQGGIEKILEGEVVVVPERTQCFPVVSAKARREIVRAMLEENVPKVSNRSSRKL